MQSCGHTSSLLRLQACQSRHVLTANLMHCRACHAALQKFGGVQMELNKMSMPHRQVKHSMPPSHADFQWQNSALFGGQGNGVASWHTLVAVVHGAWQSCKKITPAKITCLSRLTAASPGTTRNVNLPLASILLRALVTNGPKGSQPAHTCLSLVQHAINLT